MDPAAATFHQANRVKRIPVKAATGTGVALEPLHFHSRVAVRVRWLRQTLIVAVMTTTKKDITNQGFYISKDRKMDSTSLLDQSATILTSTFYTYSPGTVDNPQHICHTAVETHYKITVITKSPNHQITNHHHLKSDTVTNQLDIKNP